MKNPQITGLKTSTCLLEIHHGTMCLLYTDGLCMASLMCILETWRKNKLISQVQVQSSILPLQCDNGQIKKDSASGTPF